LGVQVQLRPVDERDAAVVSELCEHMRAELTAEASRRTHLGHAGVPEVERVPVTTLGDARGSLALLGLLEGVPVGLVLADTRQLDASSLVASIQVLYVEPLAREVGVGEALMDATTKWAKREGATGMDIPVLPGMRAPKSFLESSGFVARLLVMHKHLG
jgi:GNAT superfamily N-acetyltransferase